MSNEIFLIDANSLITPHLTYYPFDFALSFWSQMEIQIENGSIAILDMVKREILQGNDKLKEWMEGLEVGLLVDHRSEAVFQKYSDVLTHLQTNPCYKSSALAEWAKSTVADPWLIATAAVNRYTIITFEKPNNNLNPHSPSKTAKIPNVADVFGVKVENLYYMMRKLDIHL